jgi:rod shape determining protein RodA
LTFINPEHDPLGAGYHIIQSKIAIGSGGLWGKGWMNGTQAHLNFLPEHATDFIFALFAEEFGFIGTIILISICLLIIFRMAYMASNVQNTFKRLLSASITIMFSIACIVNIGMVTGILPVVGVPLTFISYGGTSILTMMAAFGVLMSMYNHRDLMTS